MLDGVAHDLRRIVAAVVVVSMLLTGLITSASAQSDPRPQNPDLVVNAATTFVVDSEAGSVSVSVEYLLVNTTSDVQVTQFSENLPLAARDIVVQSGSQPLGAVRIGTTDDLGNWVIPLVRVLRPGREVNVSLSYTLLGDDPADPESTVVINPAYVSLPVSSVGGPDGAHSVEIFLPSEFSVVESPGFVETDSFDALVLTDSGASAPYSRVGILATDLSMLEVGSLPDLGIEVDVKGWPDHLAWSRLVSDATSSIVSQFTNWFGPPPVDSIEILEGSADAYPDPGVGEPANGRVSLVVSPSVDAGLLGRQLARLWMDPVLPEIPWFGEAAIDSFGTTAARVVDPAASSPDDQIDGFDLNAHVLVDSVMARIGGDKFAVVIEAVGAGVFTYSGPGADNAEPLPSDWHTLLDTLSAIGPSVDSENLFRQVLTDPSDLDALDQRAVALVNFRSLIRDSRGWELPIWVRSPLAKWDFDTFDTRRLEAAATLTDSQLLSDEAAAAQIDLGEYVRSSFEGAEAGMDNTNSVIADQRSALEAIVETDRVIESNSGLISRIGLIGTDVVARRGEIEGSFAAGRFDIARELSQSLIKTIEGSGARGVLRLVIPLAGVAAIGFVVAEVMRRRKSGSVSGGEETVESGS